jgi:hypothetical protein
VRSDLLTLPEPELHRLFVWAHPETKTKTAALAAIAAGPDVFEPNPNLVRLAELLEHDGRIAIDYEESALPDRFILVAVRRTQFDGVMPWFVQLCRELGLVLFDPEGERLLSPSSKVWTATKPRNEAVTNAVRDATMSVDLSTNRDDAAREMTAQILALTGGQLGQSLLPSGAATPFDVPRSLRFVIPDAVPERRRSKAARSRYLAELSAERPETRRAAAFDLGGWKPDEQIDRRLNELLASEPDHYVLAVVALSLALRGTASTELIIRASTDIVTNAERNVDQQFAELAATIGVLAAAIAVAQSGGEARCAECVELTRRVSMLPGEAARAGAIATILAEHCPPP